MATTQGQSVQTVNIKGKEYVQVAERVKIAGNDENNYEFVGTDIFEVAGHALVKVSILVKGKLYVGTSEAKLSARPGTADGDAPFECAETSALGRALGFAGIGVIDGIASADEVNRAITNPKQGYTPRQNTDDGEVRMASEGQIATLKKNKIPTEMLKGLTADGAKELFEDAKANAVNGKWVWKWERETAAPKATPKRAPAVAPTYEDVDDADLPF